MKHHQGYRCNDCGIEDGKHIPLVGIKPQVQTKWFFKIDHPSFNRLGFVTQSVDLILLYGYVVYVVVFESSESYLCTIFYSKGLIAILGHSNKCI